MMVKAWPAAKISSWLASRITSWIHCEVLDSQIFFSAATTSLTPWSTRFQMASFSSSNLSPSWLDLSETHPDADLTDRLWMVLAPFSAAVTAWSVTLTKSSRLKPKFPAAELNPDSSELCSLSRMFASVSRISPAIPLAFCSCCDDSPDMSVLPTVRFFRSLMPRPASLPNILLVSLACCLKSKAMIPAPPDMVRWCGSVCIGCRPDRPRRLTFCCSAGNAIRLDGGIGRPEHQAYRNHGVGPGSWNCTRCAISSRPARP